MPAYSLPARSIKAPRLINTYNAVDVGRSTVGLIVTTAPAMVTCDEVTSTDVTVLLSDTFLMMSCCPGPGATLSEKVKEILLTHPIDEGKEPWPEEDVADIESEENENIDSDEESEAPTMEWDLSKKEDDDPDQMTLF